MKSITINGSQRESVGKKATKALRNAGQVPCVLYGGDQNVHFSAPELAFSKLVYTPNAHTVVIALDNGETYDAVLQDIQFHPVTDRILHIDFYRLFEDKEIAMDIPVHIIGTSRGVLNGGVLRRNRRKLRVKALPKNLPDFLEADITKLKIGGKLYVTALEGEDYTLLHADNTVVVQVKTARTAILDDEDEDEDELEEGAEGAAEGAAAEGGDAPAAEAQE
ncbi:50S ribosomal protein L25/general stress protein Ctc [Psychroserpens sp.]|uniref:50S ribosomal protein L25/general stress protein Ctc n=1 Tax=Psychroserpens sp. TaxID=2020870 RepID=UPI001B2A817A|nr:50S ribosomal protein L25/general stress protein Ctc [Psychroserpens sp.]MBO6607738.1 50S ribosomal protein L25/general stress protein Ctc [Psychroserpens sp.]MBO6630217.1 50S ribosomal protein L25/general stress protein Ctc [Psychroserpens sp.]MBO6654729.1 50S ribosomal protein L25/general stress protein Ctc [Psychroserpens sp.]MBO6682847.1 50S ribosomal protein L25/general stress protein Ctc [Psychroserpens sp.]MBO6751096.1 50S ribosomal protein L25/general stress protein Ctc [Psychroserp